MNLHFSINDKFVQNFIEQTIELNLIDEHFFIVYGRAEIPFSRDIESKNIIIVDELKDLPASFFNTLHIETIYIHYLSDDVIDFLDPLVLSEIKIAWLFWGSDGFFIPQINEKLGQLEPFDFLTLIRRAKKRIANIFSGQKNKKLSFLAKINYFAHYLHEDFLLFSPYMSPSCEFIYFSYGIAEHLVLDVKITGQSILLGNSGDRSNNHIYVIEKILNRKISNEILCPLSYAGNDHYKKEVINKGLKKFPNTFKPLEKILSLEDYTNEVLAKSEIAIMYQLRPQGFGNIIQLLYQGSKVFMNKKNNLYIHLVNEGFCVYPLTLANTSNLFVPLTEKQKKINKEKIINAFGKISMLKHYKKLLTLHSLH